MDPNKHGTTDLIFTFMISALNSSLILAQAFRLKKHNEKMKASGPISKGLTKRCLTWKDSS